MSTKKKRELRRSAPMRRSISTSPLDSAENSHKKRSLAEAEGNDGKHGDGTKLKKRKKQK